ncbi:hypothetical protein GCM10027578_36350 [Spirosoma luteolum]
MSTTAPVCSALLKTVAPGSGSPVSAPTTRPVSEPGQRPCPNDAVATKAVNINPKIMRIQSVGIDPC